LMWIFPSLSRSKSTWVWSATSMAATRATVPAVTTSNDSGGGPSIRAVNASRFSGSSARRSSAWRARSPSETEAARVGLGRKILAQGPIEFRRPLRLRHAPGAELCPGEHGQHANGLGVVQSSDHVVHH
jgi:hypothetical protein